MDRRRFLLTSLAGAVAAPLGAEAQQARKVYRVGILSPGGVPDPSVETAPNLVRRHLHELGYVDGGNVVVVRRFADGKTDRLPAFARELVRLPADVIVTAGAEATQAARDATGTVPIVMVIGSDPVARGG